MKLNDIDFEKFSDKELITLCLKYKLIESHELSKSTRKDLLSLIRKYLEYKLKNYGQKNKDSKSVSVNRRMSVSGNIQKNTLNYSKSSGPPRPIIARRMSDPITRIEKIDAVDTHEKMEVKQNSQKEVSEQIQSLNPKYDQMFDLGNKDKSSLIKTIRNIGLSTSERTGSVTDRDTVTE